MVIRKSWRFVDRISWLEERERSLRVMRQSAFIIHRCGDGRRQIAGTKANVYGVFTSCTWTRRRRGIEGSFFSIPVRLFIQIFLFPSEGEGTLIRPPSSDFGFLPSRGKSMRATRSRFYWITKIERRRDTVVEFERKMRPRVHTYDVEKLVPSNFSLK